MAHKRYANAIMARQNIQFDEWMDEYREQNECCVSKDHVGRIAKQVLRKCNPAQYLLSHATIVASVDTYEPKNLKLGKRLERGAEIEVRFPDFRIKPNCQPIINNNCCPPGTMILMADGTEKPIEEVEVGDSIISHTGHARQVIKTFVHPHNGLVYEIRRRGDSRRLTVTGEHPIYSHRPRRVGARTVFTEESRFSFISAGLLQKYDLLVIPRLQKTMASGITPGKAKLIGYFLAEGYFYKQARDRVSEGFRNAFPGLNSIPCSLQFALCNDESDTLAADIRRLLREEFGVDSKVATHGSSENAIVVTSRRSLELVQFFLYHCGQGARSKRVSPEIMTLDPSLQLLILQGWLEGDGTVKRTLTGGLSSCTASEDLASQIVHMFHRCGVVASIHRTVRNGRKRVRTADGGWAVVNDPSKTSFANIITINSVDAEQAVRGSWLERSYHTAASVLKKHNFLKFRVQSEKIITQVLGITSRPYCGSVYNFETEIDHSYVANGVAVHNSDAWERSLLLSTYRTFIGAPNYCFAPGTMILMADGTQCPIEDVRVGDEVIGGSGFPKKVVHKHVRDYAGDVRHVYVGHRRQPIICTPNHPFFRLDRTSCISCDTSLPVSGRPTSYKHRIFRQFCASCGRRNRKGSDRIPSSVSVRADSLERRAILFAPIPKLISQSAMNADAVRCARLMGFYLAEGCITHSHGRPSGVIFSVGANEQDLIQQILDVVRALYPATKPVIQTSRASDACVRITVWNSEMARSLQALCGELSHQKRISTQWINTASPDEIHNLIGAYVSGDADVHSVTQRVRVCSVSLHLLQQIQFLGSCVGLSGFIVEHSQQVGDVSMVKFRDGTVHEIVCQHQAHVLHFDVGSSKKICDYTTSHKSQKRTVASGDLKFLGDKRITFVNKIEKASYSGKVFNLEVEDDHSYVIDGTVLVANCEHIQLPELSKGFIVDAIARDLGDTCYIDILVATDRKHKILVGDILSGKMDSLSMGCISLFTICNHCGNVAVDDSQLCGCIMYDGKGMKFTDEDGTEHALAELIGHVSVSNSNQFIEASWVRNPAFRGAVRRNILNPDNSAVAVQMSDSAKIYELRRDEINIDGILRAASQRLAQDDPAEGPLDEDPETAEELDTLGLDEGADAGAEGGESADAGAEGGEPADVEAEGGEPGAEETKPVSPIREMLDKAKELILEELVKSLSEELAPKPGDVGTATPGSSDVMAGNDNLTRSFTEFDRRLRKVFPDAPKLVKWASRAYRTVHGGGIRGLRAAGMTSRDLIVLSWIEDSVGSRIYPPDLYKVAMSVGSPRSYPSKTSYLAACRMRLGRRLTQDEAKFLSWKGRIASLSTTF